jgi:hypothetical protein
MVLKLLTVSVVAVPLFVVASVVPGQTIRAFGHPMTTSVWWSSGAGLATVAASLPVVAGSILMLKRSQYGRALYAMGWAILCIAAPLIGIATGADVRVSASSVISNLAMPVMIGLYLWKSSAVQAYFDRAK